MTAGVNGPWTEFFDISQISCCYDATSEFSSNIADDLEIAM
jgi:hypothetical protein